MHINANTNWSRQFLGKLQGDPTAQSYIGRKGYGLALVFDTVRKTFAIRKPDDILERHYHVTTVSRLDDAIRAGFIAPGEDLSLWDEYRNQYKWELPKAPSNVMDEPEELYHNGPCCVWPREWSDEDSTVLLDRAGKALPEDDDALMADAWAQVHHTYRRTKGGGWQDQNQGYYFGIQNQEVIEDLKDECDQMRFDGATEDQMYDWLMYAERELERLPDEPKTIRRRFYYQQVIDTLNECIVARWRDTFPGWQDTDDPAFDAEWIS